MALEYVYMPSECYPDLTPGCASLPQALRLAYLISPLGLGLSELALRPHDLVSRSRDIEHRSNNMTPSEDDPRPLNIHQTTQDRLLDPEIP